MWSKSLMGLGLSVGVDDLSSGPLFVQGEHQIVALLQEEVVQEPRRRGQQGQYLLGPIRR
jgi:hypothetical protein